MIILWRQCADETWSQIVLYKSIMTFVKIYLYFLHMYLTYIVSLFYMLYSLFSNSIFNWNFHFLALCFTLNNGYLDTSQSCFGRTFFLASMWVTHASKSIAVSWSFFWMRIICPKSSSLQNKCGMKERFLIEKKMICAFSARLDIFEAKVNESSALITAWNQLYTARIIL